MTNVSLPSKKMIPFIIAASSLAMFMSVLDGTIVNIALPTISAEFSLSSSTVAWVTTIYLLVNAGSLFFIGKIINVAGYKKIFLAGFVIFVLGSFACGLFPSLFNSFPLLLVARVLQAIGGAVMAVISPALISRYIPEERQAKGIAAVMMMTGLGSALGPTLGGLLTEFIGWNWIFYINVPIGIIGIIIGLVSLPKDSSEKVSMKGFDGVGAGLIFVGLAALLFVFSEGAHLGWTSVPVILSIILAVIGIGGFIIREKHAADPILDLNLFKNSSFLIINIIYILLFFAFAGANYLLPFYLQLVKEIPTFNSGLLMTGLSIGLVVSGFIAGQIYLKLVGKLKFLIMGGVFLIAVGFFLLSHLHPWTGIGFIVGSLVLIGLGLGFTTTPLSTMILKSVPVEKAGMVSSLNGMERFAPMTLGISVFNILLVAGVKHLAGNAGIVTLPPKDIALSLLTTGFDFCFIVSLILTIVILILCIFISEKKLFGNK